MAGFKEATDWDIRVTHFGGGRHLVTILYENVPQCCVSFRTLPVPLDGTAEEIKHINRANKQSERLAVERALEKIRSPQWNGNRAGNRAKTRRLTMIKTCEHCGAEFTPRVGNQRYCCKECSHKDHYLTHIDYYRERHRQNYAANRDAIIDWN